MLTIINNYSMNKYLLLLLLISLAITVKCCSSASQPIVVDVVKDPITCTSSALDASTGRYTYTIQVGHYPVRVIGYTIPSMQVDDIIDLKADTTHEAK